MGGRLRIMRRQYWRVSVLRSSRFQALYGGEYFRCRGLSSFGVEDAAVRADDVDGAADDSPAGTVVLACLPAFIDEEGKWEFVFCHELAVGAGALAVDAVNDGTETFESGPIVADFAELSGADGGIVAGVEDEDDGLAFGCIQGDGAVVFVFQGEGRGV